MKITRLGPTQPILNSSTLGSGGGTLVGGTAGYVPTANGSNGWAWAENVARITSNGSNTVTGPYVNFASGSNVTFAVASNTLTINSAAAATGFVTVIDGGLETLQAHGATGATETINLASGNWHSLTLDANCTITVSGFTAAKGCSALVKVTQNGTGGWAITWDPDIVWASGADDQPAQAAGAVSWFVLASDVGDGTIYGFPVGGAASFATPAIVLGTAAAAGAAATVIRSDSTIVAFDATVPTTQAYSDAAATGSVAYAARRDHRHGMPATGGIGEILISDTPSTPLIFADLVQNEAQTDLVYADP